VGGFGVELVAIKHAQRDEFMRVAELHFRGLSSTFTPHDDWKRSYFENILDNPAEAERRSREALRMVRDRYDHRAAFDRLEAVIADDIRQSGIRKV